MRIRNRVLGLISLATAAALALAGCSSTGGKQTEAAAGTETPRLKVAMITHGVPGDTFWDIVRKGAEDAAAKNNIEFIYSADPDSARQATLVDNAIDQKVDAIALTLAKPDALKGVVQRATEAGIPVFAFNSGIEQWADLGALSYFGSDEALAGNAFGERLTEEGAKHALCVVMEQGQVALETRCKSLTEAFKGKTTKIYVNGADMPSVESTIQAKLRQDSSIDYVATLGAPFAMTALKSVEAAGSKAKVATFDTNAELVAKIEDGSVQWAVDQQPYLQGFLTVEAAWLYKYNRNFSGGGTNPVLTGPAFVDKTNIDTVAELAKRGTR